MSSNTGVLRDIALTDDEAIALGIMGDGWWPGPMPTVPAQTPDLAAASTRGIRSLGVRGLVDTIDGKPRPTRELEEVARSILEGHLVLASYMADDELSLLTNGFTLLHYATHDPDLWISQQIDPTGVHFVRLRERDEWLEFTLDMMEGTYVNGIVGPTVNTASQSDEPVATRLCVMAPGSAITIAAAVGQGVIEVHERDPQGDTLSVRTLDSAHAALESVTANISG